MKQILKTVALALLVVLGSSLLNKTSAQYDNYDNRQDVTYQTFYDELSPYGQWIDNPNYGYVWVPDAGPDFRPYSTNGHWVWTDNYEWMWVSDYDWGWGPFHYGRWEEDPYYSWIWIPGYEWSPAWVAWRDGGDYYGWAPLRPGISISINFGNYSPPYDYWCFAPRQYITSPRIYDYCVDRRQNLTIINYTTIIVNNSGYSNNYGFRSGPSRYEAERYCGRINPVRFRDSYTPGRTQFRNNEVSVYRPNVRRDNERSFAPRQFERYDRNNSNRIARNDNFRTRNDNVNNQVPDRRGNNDFRQPRNNNDNNGQNNRSNDSRISRPTERMDRNPNQGNDNNNRRFERPNDNNGNRNNPFRQQDVRNNDQPQRQVPQQMERRQEQQQPRQFERRQQDVRSIDQPQRQQPQQMEQRQEQRQQPVQQMERRQEQPRQFERRQQDVRSIDQPQRQQPQQMEQRQEQRQQPVQQMERKQEQQSRQSDRRDNGNGQQSNGNGNGRKRFQ